VKNEEQHFDFTLETSSSTHYLDLMEVVLLKGKSYAEASTNYNIAEMARQVFDAVTRKSQKYGKQATPIHLLLYSTDWRFFLRGEVLDLIGLWLSRKPPVFATVKYVYPDPTSGALLEHVFPRPSSEFADVNEERAARTSVVFGDIRKARTEDDGTTTIPAKNPLRNDTLDES